MDKYMPLNPYDYAADANDYYSGVVGSLAIQSSLKTQWRLPEIVNIIAGRPPKLYGKFDGRKDETVPSQNRFMKCLLKYWEADETGEFKHKRAFREDGARHTPYMGMMKDACISRGQLKRCLKMFEDAGVITRLPEQVGTGKIKKLFMRLNFGKLQEIEDNLPKQIKKTRVRVKRSYAPGDVEGLPEDLAELPGVAAAAAVAAGPSAHEYLPSEEEAQASAKWHEKEAAEAAELVVDNQAEANTFSFGPRAIDGPGTLLITPATVPVSGAGEGASGSRTLTPPAAASPSPVELKFGFQALWATIKAFTRKTNRLVPEELNTITVCLLKVAFPGATLTDKHLDKLEFWFNAKSPVLRLTLERVEAWLHYQQTFVGNPFTDISLDCFCAQWPAILDQLTRLKFVYEAGTVDVAARAYSTQEVLESAYSDAVSFFSAAGERPLTAAALLGQGGTFMSPEDEVNLALPRFFAAYTLGFDIKPFVEKFSDDLVRYFEANIAEFYMLLKETDLPLRYWLRMDPNLHWRFEGLHRLWCRGLARCQAIYRFWKLEELT